MTRSLCWVAVLGVVAIPDWASACWPWWRGRPVHVGPAYPTYPAYQTYPVCVPPPVYACPPAPVYTLPPPRVDSTPVMAAPYPAPPGVGTAVPKPVAPRAVGPVRPAGGSDVPASPTAPPAPKMVDPPVVPDPLPKFPTVDIPKDLGPLPKLEVPKDPDFRPIPAPKGNVPGDAGPAARPEPAPAPPPEAKTPTSEPVRDPGAALPPLPRPGTGTAVPSPAPAFPDPLIPSPSVPVLPDPKKPDSLPSLTLPPDGPVTPPKDSTSRSSPLTGGKGGPTVRVFPASGAGTAAGGYRAVGFYNHTGRDLNLTIEGRAVTLPAKTYLHAQLAPTFTWAHGDNAAVRETVPAGSGGVDVVFRE